MENQNLEAWRSSPMLRDCCTSLQQHDNYNILLPVYIIITIMNLSAVFIIFFVSEQLMMLKDACKSWQH